jgi:predicted  nucleic acid-binding Zn-ribbon protein
LQDKTEAAIAHIDAESAEREAELEAANEEIKRLTEAALTLEEDGERLRDEFARAQAEDQDERERLHALNLALKEVRSSIYIKLTYAHL